MKKSPIISAAVLAFAIALSGCSMIKDKLNKTQPSTQPESSTSRETTYVPDYTIPEPRTQSYQDSLPSKIPFSVDLGVGWEFRDLSVNGIHRRITITFEMDSSMIPKDPCFAYYRADIIGDGMYAETVAVGREYFTDFITDYVRKTEPDQIDMELFEYDFKASTFKGKDKDYIVFSVPAAWEPNTSLMVIATDMGKLLADTSVDKSCQVTLHGENPEKYMDSTGNANFFSFSENAITYLMVSERVGGVTYLKEYLLSIDNDQITSAETGKTYTTTDTVPDMAGISIY